MIVCVCVCVRVCVCVCAGNTENPNECLDRKAITRTLRTSSASTPSQMHPENAMSNMNEADGEEPDSRPMML